MNALVLLAAGVAAFMGVGVTALRTSTRFITIGLSVGALLTGAAGIAGLTQTAPPQLSWASGIGVFAGHFAVDALAAWGLLLLGLVGLGVGLAAPRLLASMPEAYAPPTLAFLGLLFAAIAAVLTARHALTFLIAWEVMTLAGYALVLCGPSTPTRRAAGLRYLILAHVGVAGLLLSFAALYAATGTFDFDAYHDLAATAPELSFLAFVGATWGFGFKAGLVPFHAWLPSAYEEAPTPATAAMTGIMSKTAAFWMLRFVFQFLGPGPTAWGATLLALGVTTALFGILFALQQDDLKRLLAYSSIENLGLVFVGVGAATLLLSQGEPGLAALAGAASLFHVINHGSYKTLLFLGAASVEASTGTRRFDQLGGLARPMPWAAAMFLLGSVAISGLPPLNGFASEWLLLQALMAALQTDGIPGVIAAAASLCLVGLTAGLTVAAFVKAQGAAFHGQARSNAARHAPPTPLVVNASLLLLGTACVALAAAAPLLVPRFEAAVTGSARAADPTSPWRLHVGADFAPGVALVVFVGLVTLFWITTRGPGPRGLVWACGQRLRSTRATHTGRALGDSLGTIFRPALRPTRTLERHWEADATYRRPIRYAAHVRDAIFEYVYEPVPRIILATSQRIRVIQAGSIRLYLGYVLLVLVALLAFVAVKP